MMHYVRVVRSSASTSLEKRINEVLNENLKSRYVDIKYSSSTEDGSINYTAVIIFERIVL